MDGDNRQSSLERYKRQIIIKQIGEKGQKNIRKASVFLIGAGGLGSAVGYYLAAAGIGKIGIIDNDIVELSNLNRQILHNTDRIGLPKVTSAVKTLQDLNPDIKVIPFYEKLSEENVIELIKSFDLVIDCCDNFSTRYLLNKACVSLQKPLFYGAVSCFEGQAMTIIPKSGPCYNCLYPKEPSTISQEIGVIGTIAGFIGLIQATEAIKYILDKGDLLIGKLLMFNALTMDFFKLNIRRNPQCTVCSQGNNFTH